MRVRVREDERETEREMDKWYLSDTDLMFP